MNSSNPDRQSTPLTTPHRKIDIILLTDNRDGNSQERPFSEFRCSAFKGSLKWMQKPKWTPSRNVEEMANGEIS